MFCENCGSEIPSGSVFCQNCGQKAVTNSAPANQNANFVQPPVQQIPIAPVYPPNQNYMPPPVMAQPAPMQRKKKKHIGLWIFLTIFVVLIGLGTYAFYSVFLAGPKDLGIKYTQADFNQVVQKLGVHITADLGNGNSYDNKDILKGSDTATGYFSKDNSKTVNVANLNYSDYNWKFSNYKKKTIKLTDVQATAFFNEIGMSNQFLWLSKTQIKIEPDGSVKFSSSLNVRSIISDLFQGISDKIPVKLPEKMNIYLEGPGKFTINNNVVSNTPKNVSASIYTVPAKYLTDENAASFVSYFTDLFNKIDFKIFVNSFYVKDGEFYFVGTVPTEVSVTPKTAGN